VKIAASPLGETGGDTLSVLAVFVIAIFIIGCLLLLPERAGSHAVRAG